MIKNFSEDTDINNNLLQTIRIPKNLLVLTERLPQANYGSDINKNIHKNINFPDILTRKNKKKNNNEGGDDKENIEKINEKDERETKYHTLLGRIYLLSLFWCMASSLLIHNTGLPFFVIVSFLFLLFSSTIGWLVIWVASNTFNDTVNEKMNVAIKEVDNSKTINLFKLKGEEIKKMDENLTFGERYLSLKTLHGILMTFGWYQMLGRLLVTNPAQWSQCWTYPAFKCPNANFIAGKDPAFLSGMNENTLLL